MIRRRVHSWLWDYLVILAWLLVVFLLVGVPTLLRWIDLESIWEDPVTRDIAVTILTVVPYWVYLTATEAGPNKATWGKRRAGLIVLGTTPRVAAARNLVKLLPWQLGHMGAVRFATQPEPSGFALLLTTVSMVLLLAVALPPLLGRRGVHDVVANTIVTG